MNTNTSAERTLARLVQRLQASVWELEEMVNGEQDRAQDIEAGRVECEQAVERLTALVNEYRPIVIAARHYKLSWEKLQDGADTVEEKWTDVDAMHAAQHVLFEAVGGRKVTLNRVPGIRSYGPAHEEQPPAKEPALGEGRTNAVRRRPGRKPGWRKNPEAANKPEPPVSETEHTE